MMPWREVVGGGNWGIFQYLEEPFRSVDFPLKKVGEMVVETLLSGEFSRRTWTLVAELVKY